jgi:hypothetical protein
LPKGCGTKPQRGETVVARAESVCARVHSRLRRAAPQRAQQAPTPTPVSVLRSGHSAGGTGKGREGARVNDDDNDSAQQWRGGLFSSTEGT